MIEIKKHADILKKLKKQVDALEHKKFKLQKALTDVKQIAKIYEKKIVKKTRVTTKKARILEAAIYTQLAASIRKHAIHVKKVQKAVAKLAASKRRSVKSTKTSK